MSGRGAYNLKAGRVKAQIEKMRRLQSAGVCAFCPEHFERHHDNPIEFQTAHWIVSKNDYPYEFTALHLLVVAKAHVRFLRELDVQARAELPQVLVMIEDKWRLDSYSVGIRVGDPRFNGGSVDHLHAHVVVGDASGPLPQTVRFKMSSRPESAGH